MILKEIKIGDFLKRVKSPVNIKDNEEYSLITIRMFHKGVVRRGVFSGKGIKSKTLYSVRGGQFILSGIDARNSAFGIVPDELTGALISNDFWTHDINNSIVDLDFFYWLTNTSTFINACKKASEGTTNRQRLQADLFYNHKIIVPDIKKQKEIVKTVENINKNYSSLRVEIENQADYVGKLRQAILQDAVQGKLVPQNPKDEPASELLKRIKAEKAKRIEQGKLKKEKPLPPITAEEIPFELPKGWAWCRLGEICDKIGSGRTPRGGRDVYKNEGVKFIRSQNVYNEGLYFDNVAYIDEVTHSRMSGTKVLANDILINITGGSIGRCALVPNDFDEANVSQHVTIIRLTKGVSNEFIHDFILSLYFQEKIMEVQTGGNREGLAKKNMELMLISIPPISEQKRIVAKVKELMAYCNELEQSISHSQKQAEQLLQAVLKEAFEQKQESRKSLVNA